MAKLVSSTLYLSFASLFEKSGSLVLVPLLTEFLSIQDYGQLMTALSIVGLINMIMYNGLHSALFRWYSSWAESWDKRLYEKYILIITGIFAIVIALTLILLNSLIPLSPILSVDFWLFFSVYISVAVLVPYTLKMNIWIIDGNSYYAMIYSFTKSAAAVVTIWFLMPIFPTPYTKPAVEIVVSGILGIYIMYITLDSGPRLFSVPKKEAKKVIKSSLSYGWLSQISQIAYWTISSSDRIMLSHIVGTSVVGIYSIAMLGLAPVIVVTSFNSVFSANYMAMHRDSVPLRVLNAYVTQYLVIGAILIGIYKMALYKCGIYIVEFLSTSEYSIASEIMFLTADIILFYFSYLLFSRYFHACLKMKIIIYTMVIASLVNIILNLILIPLYEIYGSIYASIASYLLLSSMILLALMSQVGYRSTVPMTFCFTMLVAFNLVLDIFLM